MTPTTPDDGPCGPPRPECSCGVFYDPAKARAFIDGVGPGRLIAVNEFRTEGFRGMSFEYHVWYWQEKS